jgi:uncharacterized protein (DUF488 family)
MLLTVGHGGLRRSELTRLLTTAGVEMLVDVRRYPASRANPDVASGVMAQWLRQAGIRYRWEEELGGRRRLPPGQPVMDTWWTVAAFAAYAVHTRTPGFQTALRRLLGEAAARPVAILCSESLWWRCHRRLIADVATLSGGVGVEHLMQSGGRVPHPVAAGARLGPDGRVVWDGGESQSLV